MNKLVLSHLLVLPRLRVQNANAISSPLTHGFPSITAFLGVLWALERKLQQAGIDVPLNAIGVVCHDHQEQVTDGGFVKTFRLTRNPVDKAGKTAAIVEEGRIHLEISLVIGVNLGDDSFPDEYVAQIAEILVSMRIAGGTIHPQAKPWLRRYQPRLVALAGDEESRAKNFRELSRSLLPGFTLVARDDLLDTRLAELKTQSPDATRLDAWLSLSRINWHYQTHEDSSKSEWQHDRVSLGWVVPIPVGYGALSEVYEPGTVANTRDNTTPFRFVESLYSVGQWLSPHKLRSVEQMLWYTDSQPEKGLYRCRNDYAKSLINTHNKF